MPRRHRKLPILGMGFLLMLAVGGCDQEGPAEKAGENVDQAVEKAGDTIERKTD